MEAKRRKLIAELGKKASARRESGLFLVEGARSARETDPGMAEEIFVTREFLEGPECAGLMTGKGSGRGPGAGQARGSRGPGVSGKDVRAAGHGGQGARGSHAAGVEDRAAAGCALSRPGELSGRKPGNRSGHKNAGMPENSKTFQNASAGNSGSTQEKEGGCTALLRARGYTLVTASEMDEMSGTVTPQGILLIVKQRRYRDLDEFASAERKYAKANGLDAPLILVLETLQDPGNLGTILRMAEAAGVTGIIADSRTVDIYSPKVVRSTMGAVMRLPYITVPDLITAIAGIRSRIRWIREDPATDKCDSIMVAAAALGGSTVGYTEVDYTGACAVLIGNEAHGLSSEIIGAADICIKIPMVGRAESLNAAVAAAVISFEAARQRRGMNRSTGLNLL